MWWFGLGRKGCKNLLTQPIKPPKVNINEKNVWYLWWLSLYLDPLFKSDFTDFYAYNAFCKKSEVFGWDFRKCKIHSAYNAFCKFLFLEQKSESKKKIDWFLLKQMGPTDRTLIVPTVIIFTLFPVVLLFFFPRSLCSSILSEKKKKY